MRTDIFKEGKKVAGQRGFTLVELIVVIAIIGVLAAVAVPTVGNFVGSSKEASYTSEQQRLQSAVDTYFTDGGNALFRGQRTYPLLGRGQTDDTTLGVVTVATTVIDQGNSFANTVDTNSDSVLDKSLWNATGGVQGADLSAAWNDGGFTGIRLIDASSPDSWDTIGVTRSGTTYQTDARYFFIDFKALVDGDFLKGIPNSAAPDNDPAGVATSTYDGNYIWYLDNKGQVQSLYKEEPSQKGYVDGVFP